MADSTKDTNIPGVVQTPKVSGYSYYVLFVLFLVYIFNFVDRQIISILAENIKADLGINDAEIGFLYGTAFAVFYALFGLPLGRLADTWNRKTLISVGLGFWSLMTALSGTAKSFTSLAIYRIGVGVGEASATPAALSMLSDSFPKALRATVMALYNSGIYVGAGIGIVIGGQVVGAWDAAYPDPALAPFGLKSWQAAFMIVGVPGLLLSLLVLTLREPVRGAMDGTTTEKHPAPFKEFVEVLITVIPPFTIYALFRNNASNGVKKWNAIALVGSIIAAYTLIKVTGSAAQWTAYFVGVYATISWVQGVYTRDNDAFKQIFHNKALVYSILGFSSMGVVTYGVGFWGAPYFIRNFGVTVAEAGAILGWSSAIGGLIGVIAGGVLSDIFRGKHRAGRLLFAMVAMAASFPVAFVVFTTESLDTAYFANFVFQILSPAWIAVATSTVADLVHPKIRAVATAFYILVITMIGLALGPYGIGLFSTAMALGGMDPAEALGKAGLGGAAFALVAAVFMFIASKYYADAEDKVLAETSK